MAVKHAHRTPTTPPAYTTASSTDTRDLAMTGYCSPNASTVRCEKAEARHSLAGQFPTVSLFKEYQDAAMAKIDAKILISNLSDDFVKNQEKDFSVGKLVIGKVLSVEPLSKRVEVSLRTSSAVSAPKSKPNHLNQIIVGDIVHGKIKRVESYGLFISIDQTNVIGLCHISKLSDDHTDDLLAEFKAGERVTTKVLKVQRGLMTGFWAARHM